MRRSFVFLLVPILSLAAACGGVESSSTSDAAPDAMSDATPDAADPGNEDAGCPGDEYLIVPCCGGFNNTTCSNGPGPPPPYCAPLPVACEGDADTCFVPQTDCEGVVDRVNRTIGCNCI